MLTASGCWYTANTKRRVREVEVKKWGEREEEVKEEVLRHSAGSRQSVDTVDLLTAVSSPPWRKSHSDPPPAVSRLLHTFSAVWMVDMENERQECDSAVAPWREQGNSYASSCLSSDCCRLWGYRVTNISEWSLYCWTWRQIFLDVSSWAEDLCTVWWTGLTASDS